MILFNKGLFVAVVFSMVSIHNVSSQPTPEANPSPIIPSKLALLYTPLVCPFFYVGKAVKAAQSVVDTVTGVGKWTEQIFYVLCCINYFANKFILSISSFINSKNHSIQYWRWCYLYLFMLKTPPIYPSWLTLMWYFDCLQTSRTWKNLFSWVKIIGWLLHINPWL